MMLKSVLIRYFAIFLPVFNLYCSDITASPNVQEATKAPPATDKKTEVTQDSAITQYHGVLFEVITGSIARIVKKDPIKKCEINVHHPKIKDQLVELAGKIERAKNCELTTAFHVMPQVPSIEIYATHVTYKTLTKSGVQEERVLLLKDYETLQSRFCKESDDLIDFIRSICSPNKG